MSTIGFLDDNRGRAIMGGLLETCGYAVEGMTRQNAYEIAVKTVLESEKNFGTGRHLGG